MTSPIAADALVCAPETIFDRASFDAFITDALATSDKTHRQSIIVDDLKARYAAGHDAVSEAFLKNPLAARQTVRSYAYLAEELIKAVVDTVATKFYPKVSPTASEHLAVLMVGGSGRREMAPYSDIDLLFLTPYKKTAWVENVVESSLYILWDLKLKVGYAVRSCDECLAQAHSDFTIRTNLLEGRFIYGEEALAEDLETRLWSELFSKTGPEFVAAKLDEREQRHAKNGGTRYMVEPNVKESKGGLRDMQTLYWIAKYLYGTKSVNDLVKKKVFDRREHKVFTKAEAFLWTTRSLLHLKAGRAVEQLTFDLQVEVAQALGYKDKPGRRAAEQFMQVYFTHAISVGELTRIFLTKLETEHVKPRPGFGFHVRKVLGFEKDETATGYLELNGRLGIADEDEFFQDPVNILRLFQEARRTGLLIHPDAMRAITARRDLFTDAVRRDPAAIEVFLDLLLGNSNPERALRRMNELGVLGAFIPEFGKIFAMMQFNMYHSYTVDEHSIQCVSILSQIERGELQEDLPVVSSILEGGGINRRVLYLAVLMHDIGKGRPEDHSIIGAQIVTDVCTRLGLPSEEVETVAWLVRHHLLMSDVAQKRDISDPRTVRDFAREVRTTGNLKLLVALTVCDIRGVGPNTWNNWKAVLLRELYAATREELTEGTTGNVRLARIEQAQAEFAEGLDLSPAQLTQEIERHFAPFWLNGDVPTQLTLSRLSRSVAEDEIRHDFQLDKARGATRVCFAMSDHPGLFARISGALALAGADIKDARTYTTSDGVANSVFWIQDEAGKAYEKARLGRLRKSVGDILDGKRKAGAALAKKDAPKRRVAAVTVPTTINIDNDASEIFTLIEVDTRDRPGLLYDLTRAFKAMNLSISSAIIATYGNQAVDTFYVKDLFGHKIHDKDKRARIAARLREAVLSPDSAEPEAFLE